MVYSTNQNNQFYVVAAAADFAVKKTNDGLIYFTCPGAAGTLRSDLIDPATVKYCKLTPADSDVRYLKKATIALDANVNGGKPVVGEDYVVNITIKNYCGLGDDNVAIKHGMVHATAAMVEDVTEFYNVLKESLELNFSREVQKLLTFEATANGVVVTEVKQPWIRGIRPEEFVNFTISASDILVNGEYTQWLAVGADGQVAIEDSTTKVANTHRVADLEYFCMGERGDLYRMQGWPNVIPTKYLVDEADENGYDIINLHYAFTDYGVDSYKSEKEITIVGKKGVLNTDAFKNKFTTAGITFKPTV